MGAMFDDSAKAALLSAADRGGLLENAERVEAMADVLPKALRQRRSVEPTARAQMKADLALLQSLSSSEADSAIVERYLERMQSASSAAGFAAFQEVRQQLFGARPRSFQPIDPNKQFPERILVRDETLPIAFLERGAAAAKGVGKILVPGHQGGAAIGTTARGTAWLLTPRHVVTCLHVIHARDTGRATDVDLKLQVAASTVAFDDSTTMNVAAVVAAWDDLDVAVLALTTEVTGRDALPCRTSTLPKPSADAGFYVNLIQFPRGEEKRVGLRANAALDVTERDVYYFTDSEQGSSGAPCLDDAWAVIAVHRAWEVKQGVEYLGRTVGFANVGTRIESVLARLEAHAPEVHALVRRA
jgi:hypothetical protein